MGLFSFADGGAGDGNRTHVMSLGSSGSAIELHPHALDSKRLQMKTQGSKTGIFLRIFN